MQSTVGHQQRKTNSEGEAEVKAEIPDLDPRTLRFAIWRSREHRSVKMQDSVAEALQQVILAQNTNPLRGIAVMLTQILERRWSFSLLSSKSQMRQGDCHC